MNGTMYIRVEQAKLTNKGFLDSSTLEWKTAGECSESGLVALEFENLVYLDEIRVTGHLLVGFRFIKDQKYWRLQAAMTPIINVKEQNSTLGDIKFYGNR